jgi:hypothetical protein
MSLGVGNHLVIRECSFSIAHDKKNWRKIAKAKVTTFLTYAISICIFLSRQIRSVGVACEFWDQSHNCNRERLDDCHNNPYGNPLQHKNF